jgi:hypothetical protein
MVREARFDTFAAFKDPRQERFLKDRNVKGPAPIRISYALKKELEPKRVILKTVNQLDKEPIAAAATPVRFALYQ